MNLPDEICKELLTKSGTPEEMFRRAVLLTINRFVELLEVAIVLQDNLDRALVLRQFCELMKSTTGEAAPASAEGRA